MSGPTRFGLSMEMSRLTRDGTAELVLRDQILRRERGQGNIDFPCSADDEQDWQPYPVNPYSCCICDHASTTHTTGMRRRVARVLSAARTFPPLAGGCSEGMDAFRYFFYKPTIDCPYGCAVFLLLFPSRRSLFGFDSYIKSEAYTTSWRGDCFRRHFL